MPDLCCIIRAPVDLFRFKLASLADETTCGDACTKDVAVSIMRRLVFNVN